MDGLNIRRKPMPRRGEGQHLEDLMTKSRHSHSMPTVGCDAEHLRGTLRQRDAKEKENDPRDWSAAKCNT